MVQIGVCAGRASLGRESNIIRFGGGMLVLMKMALNQCTKHLRRQLRVLESCFLWANQLLIFFFFLGNIH